MKKNGAIGQNLMKKFYRMNFQAVGFGLRYKKIRGVKNFPL